LEIFAKISRVGQLCWNMGALEKKVKNKIKSAAPKKEGKKPYG
jgi:hypothetical protein